MARSAIRGGSWKRTGRVAGRDIAAIAKPVWVCEKCGLWHPAKPNRGCLSCGILATFMHFHSEGEAKKWARLKLEERAGQITDLRRQVDLPLMTVGPNGLPVQWGKMIVDFAFKDAENRQRYVDFKPDGSITPDAALKIRCLEAQGIIVELVSEKGEV